MPAFICNHHANKVKIDDLFVSIPRQGV